MSVVSDGVGFCGTVWGLLWNFLVLRPTLLINALLGIVGAVVLLFFILARRRVE